MLISYIYDKKENGFTKYPAYTEEDYMKEHKKRDKNQGGLCEIVGLEEFQVKSYFDLDPKGDFDYSVFNGFEVDIKRIYYNLVSKEGVVNVAEREPREEEFRELNVIKHSRRYYL